MSRFSGDIPRRVFVDTSAFYATADPRDVDSQTTMEILRVLVARQVELVTTNFVVAELHALLIARGSREVARRSLSAFYRSRVTTVIRATEDDEQRALAIILQYVDKDFSFTDAISFAVMERLGISHAFSLDRHFAQFGWVVLPAVPE